MEKSASVQGDRASSKTAAGCFIYHPFITYLPPIYHPNDALISLCRDHKLLPGDFISTETIMSIPTLSRVPGQLPHHRCGITATIWWITYANVILLPAPVGSVNQKEQRESKDQDSSQQKTSGLCVLHTSSRLTAILLSGMTIYSQIIC